VNLYVARACGTGFKKHGMSKPCIRCTSQLIILGFKKVYYMNDMFNVTVMDTEKKRISK
jgi:deoxycytidylate deaminase